MTDTDEVEANTGSSSTSEPGLGIAQGTSALQNQTTAAEVGAPTQPGEAAVILKKKYTPTVGVPCPCASTVKRSKTKCRCDEGTLSQGNANSNTSISLGDEIKDDMRGSPYKDALLLKVATKGTKQTPVKGVIATDKNWTVEKSEAPSASKGCRLDAGKMGSNKLDHTDEANGSSGSSNAVQSHKPKVKVDDSRKDHFKGKSRGDGFKHPEGPLPNTRAAALRRKSQTIPEVPLNRPELNAPVEDSAFLTPKKVAKSLAVSITPTKDTTGRSSATRDARSGAGGLFTMNVPLITLDDWAAIADGGEPQSIAGKKTSAMKPRFP
jgi:hypothetical protein